MEFLGRDGVPYPRLKEQGSDDPNADLETLITYMKKMYEAGIVHGDLSEYNILVSDEGMHVIDLSQGTVIENTTAREFLERDIENVLRYFSKYITVPSKEDVFDRITGVDDGE
jgi:RIO kinase 1